MRRFPLILVLVTVLAGCSSGSSNVASSTKSTSPTTASQTTPAPDTVAPTSAVPAGGAATNFCGAFKELETSKATGNTAAFGAGFRAAAADMRKFAPAEIKDAAGTYADLIDSIGTSAQGGTMDKAGLEKSLATAMAGKSADIAKVAIWVGKNCKL
jgi:hypothetical protein